MSMAILIWNCTHQGYNSLSETITYVAKAYTKYVSNKDEKAPFREYLHLTSNELLSPLYWDVECHSVQYVQFNI